jgi:mono/diheme cytochrome c family protein
MKRPLIILCAAIAACARGTATSGAGAAAKPAANAMPAGVTAALIARGDSLYARNACQRCHGPAGVNGPNGPALAKGDSAKWLHSDGSFQGIFATVMRGVPKDSLRDKTRRFAMNPRGSSLTSPIPEEDIRAISAYIWKLNHP